MASVGSNSTYWIICDAFKSATILSNATNVSSASLTSSTTFSAKNPCGSSRNPLDREGRTTRRPRNNNYGDSCNRKRRNHRDSYILIRYESTQLLPYTLFKNVTNLSTFGLHLNGHYRRPYLLFFKTMCIYTLDFCHHSVTKISSYERNCFIRGNPLQTQVQYQILCGSKSVLLRAKYVLIIL